jgi:hypothetical protein
MPGGGHPYTSTVLSGQDYEGRIGVKSVLEFDDRQLIVER